MGNLGEFIINHWILSSMFVVLLWLIFSNSLTSGLNGFQQVDVPTAVTLVNQQKGCYVDVRDKTAFESTHIADSVNVPLTDMESHLKLLKKKEQPLVVVCDSGQRAKTAAKKLKAQGYTNLYVLSGGLHAWRDAKLPLFS